MTLSRQLAILISLLFVLVFAGTLYISVHNTRQYLAEQLQSHAQDTATSLGLSLVPPLAEGDVPLAETMVNAIFDAGYYKEIHVEDPTGGKLVERNLDVQIERVPDWFVRMITLEAPQAMSEVTTGWRYAGKVLVTSHPGYAYRELWARAAQTFWWFLGALAAAVVLLIAVLRFALAPLRQVESQAVAISEREFPILEKLPYTRELRRVVTAMNRMSQKVKRMLGDQTALTERLREQANQDPVTGLGNRRNFDARLHHLVESGEQFMSGAIYLMELYQFKAYNDRCGYEAGDELLRQSGIIVRRVFGDGERNVVARLGGASFGIIARNVTPEEARDLADRLTRELAQLHDQGFGEKLNLGHVGCAYYRGGRAPSELLAEADMALRAADRQGANAFHMYEPQDLSATEIHGSQQWSQILRDVIRRRDVVLHFQPTVACDSRSVLHYEVLARIAGDGEVPVSAGVFMPMAERHGLTQDLDRVIVEAVIASVAGAKPENVKFAVNLSPESIHDAGFIDWLCQALRTNSDVARRLIFEAPEYGATADLAGLRSCIDQVRQTGAQFALDHFGAGFTSFGYLRDLKLDYIKIDGSYIRGLPANKDNQFFVNALADIAHGLDIQVVAESVETPDEWGLLAALHIDAAQGFHLGRPQPEPG